MDSFSKEKRSEVMSRIRGRDTLPEMKIRKALHARGFRYRIHCSDLPGKPDLKFKKYRAVILINGCFWHGHDCHLFRLPKSRVDYWHTKIERNKERDKANWKTLLERGWRLLIVWECSIKGKKKLDEELLLNSICDWLKSDRIFFEIKGQRSDNDIL